MFGAKDRQRGGLKIANNFEVNEVKWSLTGEWLTVGCLEGGYMVLPASNTVRKRLVRAARASGVPVDGHVPE